MHITSSPSDMDYGQALSTSTKAIQQRTKAEVDNAVKLWDKQ